MYPFIADDVYIYMHYIVEYMNIYIYVDILTKFYIFCGRRCIYRYM